MSKGARPAGTVADAKLTSKGQLTLPASVREAMRVKTGDALRFEPADGAAFKVTPVRRGDLLDLAGVFAGAGERVGDLDIRELRRRTAVGRARKLARRRSP